MLTSEVVSFENISSPLFVFMVSAFARIGHLCRSVSAFFATIFFAVISGFLLEFLAAIFAGQYYWFFANLAAGIIALFGTIAVYVSAYSFEFLAALLACWILALFAI